MNLHEPSAAAPADAQGDPRRPGAWRDIADEFDLRDLLRMLWRRRKVIAGTMILLTAIAAVVTFQLTPVYRAATQVMVEPRESNVVDMEAVLSGLPADTETINSEIEVIESRHLADKVIERLDLDRDPEFNPALQDPSPLAQASETVADWFGAQGVLLGADQRDARERAEVVDVVLENLEVSSRVRSRVITIEFSSEDPEKSAEIANTIGDLYLVDQLEAKYEATQRATQWLGDRIQGLRESVEASERAVEQYRREAGLVSGRDEVALVREQISELSSELILAKSRRAEAEARLDQVNSLMESDGVYSAAEVLSSEVIQELKEQEAQVVRKVGELSEEYGDRHPRMINARNELEDIRASIATEVRRIVQNLENEAQVAGAREASLRASLNELENRASDLDAKSVELRALEREAEANRVLLENMLTRFKEITTQQELQRPDARIISAATVPVDPAFPKPGLIVGLTLVASLFLGVLLAVAAEQLDAGFRSLDQVERFVGMAGLGLIPKLSRAARPGDYALEKPLSAYAEALRNLHLSVTLSNVDRPPKTVLVTSSVPEEGKSSTALALGRLLAKAGHRILLIDCDLRRPTLHQALDVEREPGLVEVLSQRATLDEAVRTEEQSKLRFVTAGRHAPNPSDLLGSEHMRSLLRTVREDYDLVLLDSAPTISISDSRMLAGVADTTVLLVRWEKTRRETVANAIKQLDQSGAQIAGIVLNAVDVKRHAEYGYSDSGYYHGAYAKYYTS